MTLLGRAVDTQSRSGVLRTALLLPGLLMITACATTSAQAPSNRVLSGPMPNVAVSASHGPNSVPPARSNMIGAGQVTQGQSTPAYFAGSASAAVELRSALERLLGAHILLADELVRAELRGDTPLAQATLASVDANRQELALNISKVAGAEAGGAFGAAWEEHVAALVQYANALRDMNVYDRAAARGRLTRVEKQLAAALSQTVAGAIPVTTLQQAVTVHYGHLVGQADAFAAGDYVRAYQVEREGFAHMIMVADVLTRGIAKAKKLPVAELDAPRRTLQSALSHLLAEHMGLMVETMRAASDRTPDFRGAGRALNANTADLAAAISVLYGPAAGRQFLQIWSDHVEGLVDYASKPQADEASKQAAIRTQVANYAPKLARFLATATAQRLPAIELAASLTEHDSRLREQAAAYAAKDQAAAQQAESTGYVHMFGLSQALATAIGDTVASRLPRGGAQTGGGGLASRF